MRTDFRRMLLTLGALLVASLALMADQRPSAPADSRAARLADSRGVRLPPDLAATATPTFTRDVAPVLYKNCTTCHRPGEVAPMSLLTYEEARPWARAIRSKVMEGAMPPWHADPKYGRFSNERRLTAEEKDLIVRWANGGAPKGDPKDLPPLPAYPDGWTIGQPDAVVSLPLEYEVPPQGEIAYQYFESPTNFTEDRWVRAMEIRPGNRAVVHHVLVFCREPSPSTRETVMVPVLDPSKPFTPQAQTPPPPNTTTARRGPLIATTAPGMNPTVLAPGTAMFVKAGSILTFQMHYTTNGVPTTDRTSIGFIFAKEPPAVEVRATAFSNGRFVIPPGAPDHPVESAVGFLEDVTIYSIFPHTHLRGKAWEYRLLYPDGRAEIVLSVPKYDFNWQIDYLFAQPLKAPKGSVLTAVARYDNSAANPANPDPTMEVRWGDQTWEEMQYTGLNYSVDRARPTTTAPAGR